MAFLDFLVEQELNELVVRGNRSTKDKIKKKRLNRMKRLKKCSGNLTPSVTTVNGVQKVTCTPKDRKRARMMKRVSRRLKANPLNPFCSNLTRRFANGKYNQSIDKSFSNICNFIFDRV